MRSHGVSWAGCNLLVLCVLGLSTPRHAWTEDLATQERVHQITVPETDRFTPFALTIRTGDTVEWVNRDTDDHTIVSDDVFNTTGHRGIEQLLPGTDSTGVSPGKFRLRFFRPGIFVYYCRFHAHLDEARRPVAPGPAGGIQDPQGNFGTPMMEVTTIRRRSEVKPAEHTD